MTKEIPLTKGKVALVDDDDYENLIQYNWCMQGRYAGRAKNKKRGEAGDKKTIAMHRVIMGLWDRDDCDLVVDHINGNPLDNRKSNLRICTQHNNLFNQKKENKFGYKGIVKFFSGKYQVMIWNGKKNIHIGMFESKESAARAYDKAAKELHGEYAYLNFPDES